MFLAEHTTILFDIIILCVIFGMSFQFFISLISLLFIWVRTVNPTKHYH
jgi:hypothetical protein